MNKLPIQNIANIGNKIFLFCREPDNSLKIIEDSKFMPYYFQECLEGAYKGFDGTKLMRMDCNDPSDMRKQRNEQSWSIDLNYTYRYLVDKVDEILPSNPRIIFFDIEVQCTDLPQPKETQTVNDPISTIVIYDNYVKKYKTFFIKDYKSEFEMLGDFCKTIKELKCDCLAGWNCKDFDYCYLYYRYPDFPKKISPIGMSHWRNGIEMPAGISIVDMTGMDVKFTLSKRDSYKLKNVAHEDLGTELWEDEDFMDIEMSKKKCLEDVKKLVGLNDKNKYFEFFDSIRRFSKTTWEDQPAEYKNYSWQSLNSKPWDILFYQIAKKLNVILPNKPNYNEFEREEFKTNVFYKKDGAYRDTFQKGIFFDCLKVDLGSCYPRMIIDFNLDNANLQLQKDMPNWFPSEDEIAENINKGYIVWSQTKWGQYLVDNNIIPVPIYFRESKEELMKRKEYKDNFPENWKELRWICYYKQNPNTITPQAFDSPMKWKQELKNKLKEVSTETPEGKSIESAYKSCKGFNNCFVPNTKILTINGVKNIQDIKIGDKVYNVNPYTLKVEIDNIIDIQIYDYNDIIYDYRTRNTHLKVTKEHKFLVHRYGKFDIGFKTIEEISNQESRHKYVIPKLLPLEYDGTSYITLLKTLQDLNGMIWIRGKTRKLRYEKKNRQIFNFIQSKIYRSGLSGWRKCLAQDINEEQLLYLYQNGWEIYGQITPKTKKSPIVFKTQDFCKFLGWFISEGSINKTKRKKYLTSVRGSSYRIIISQYKDVNFENYEKIKNLIKKLGFHINVDSGYDIAFCSEILYEYLKKQCYHNFDKMIMKPCRYKKIPDFLFNESYTNRLSFFKYLYLGDGDKKCIRYSTSSNFLKLDLLKFLVTLGYGLIHYYTDKQGCNRLHFSNHTRGISHCIKKINYDGKVYCCTTKNNHTLFAGLDENLSLTGQSGFGTFGNIYTRLFNLHIFNTVTCLPRDLLHFLENKLNKVNIQIIFIDTDSFVLNTTDVTIVDKLNDWIIEWTMDKYNNQNVNVVLEYEGIFKQLYVGSKCRYIGMLEKPNGEIETEKKGLQLVRRDYEKFVKDFQFTLIKQKLWEKHSKEEIIEWIKEQINEFKNVPLRDISFPCKINKPREDYKTSQPYFEAIDETQKLNKNFKKGIGDKFWWIYMIEPRVLAFDKENQEHIDRNKIDWSQMIEKCIFNLLIPIFKSLSWEEDLLKLTEEYQIILGSQYRNDLIEELDNKDDLKIKYSAKEVKKRMNEKLGIVKPEKIKKDKEIWEKCTETRKEYLVTNDEYEASKETLEKIKVKKTIDSKPKNVVNLNKEEILEELKKRGLL